MRSVVAERTYIHLLRKTNTPHTQKYSKTKRHKKSQRQCTVNEAYNLIYCGRFEDAKLVLKELFVSCGPEDKVTRNQCRSAWLLGKRLKRTLPVSGSSKPCISNSPHWVGRREVST